MAIPAQRRFDFSEIRHFGSREVSYDIPDLTVLQTDSYRRFLQEGVPPKERKNQGLEAVLREVFPIESTDNSNPARLEYLYYELEKPKYEPDVCRQLRLTYGRPFKVRLRLVRENDAIEENVLLGELPIMLGGGEFIINGAERVVVSQLHRSPGMDFVADTDGERRTVSCRIIPERGSWIEFQVTRKETVTVRIDQSGKLPLMVLLRAMDEKLGTDAQLLKQFYETRSIKVDSASAVAKIEGLVSVSDVVYPKESDKAGEVIIEAGHTITKVKAEAICASGVKKIEVMDAPKNRLILNSLEADKTKSHEEALIRIYLRLRPGNPVQIEKARELFRDKFCDGKRYRLGRVGRFRINRKLGLNVDLDETALMASDLVHAVQYLNRIWIGDRTAEVDDIDHLGNRRLRTIDELASDELRKGFLKLRRTVQKRMSERGAEATPQQIVNQKSISSAIELFFGRGELSQVVDQTNPLSMLTHERRLSALGPGGLNRKRAGFDVRDVHSSHYGRLCPIETPEGTSIGLIASMAIYAGVDEFGFLIAPYRKVNKRKVTNQIDWLRADQEHDVRVAPADTPIEKGHVKPDPISKHVIVRHRGDYDPIHADQVEYIDVSPSQMVGVSAGLIPFLEHDDAVRALMGSNMQRQAVPLLVPEPPLVATGLERNAAYNSSLLVHCKRSGTVMYVDASRIEVTDGDVTDRYDLRKFVGLNERTCQNQTPCVRMGDKVNKGDILADGASMFRGQLCLGRNVLVAFMVWDGFNFEDAIVISEELVQNDTYTSLHIEECDVDIRDTKLGHEEFTRDISNVSDRMLRNLDEGGIVHVGTYVRPGDVLVGKVSQLQSQSPGEKLLHAIFGRAGEDVKNESLEVPSGTEGIVIGTQKFACRKSLTDEERYAFDAELASNEKDGNHKIAKVFGGMVEEMEKILKKPLVDEDGNDLVQDKNHKYIAKQATSFLLERFIDEKHAKYAKLKEVYDARWYAVEAAINERDRRINTMKRGDGLKRGVLQSVKVYIATKRVISVGDKMAGRHGNKGVIAKILPREDMPFLADGTPIQIMLNPLGVPSRMNIGQILETHLGWAAAKVGYQAVTPVFNGATEKEINDKLTEAGLPKHGKVQLYDGRTGEMFEQETTVGYLYMLKLHHLVDDKVHARSTGSYSLITQQPLGGKARFGGQRFGEMEVWALEAYGAAYTLQELLTVKSDDVEGRTKIYESMVKGENTLEAGTPASFDVLTNEIRGLALNMKLLRSRLT